MKRAESPGVLVAFWRMVMVSVVWNVYLWSTGRRVTLRDVRQAFVPGVFFGLNLADVLRRGDAQQRRQRRADRLARRRS